MSEPFGLSPPSGAAGMMRADPIPPDAAQTTDIKAYLRLAGTDEDGLIARLGAVALAHGEAFTGQLLLTRTVTETVPARAEWRRLAATPVGAITGVSGLSPLGVAIPLAADGYAIDIDAAGDGWVRLIAPAPSTRLVVTCTAGLAATWGTLPDALRQGAVRLAAHLFTNRDSAEEGAPPAAVAALWRPWRRMRLS